MQARYYDPLIGRFYSNDPVDTLGHMAAGDVVHGFNRYRYAKNNPYKYKDPDGRFDIPANFTDFFGDNEGAQFVASKQRIAAKAGIAPKANAKTLKLISDVATATAILSPVGRGVAGAVALGADIADIAINSEDLATDATAKAMGEIAASSLTKKVGPLIDAIPTKQIKESVGDYLKESSKEYIKDQTSSATEDFVKKRDN